MEEASTSSKQKDIEMSAAPAAMTGISQENGQAGLPKNMVPDPGWFDRD